MPPSAKRRSARKREAVSRKTVNTEVVNSSPTRPAKKRKGRANGAVAPLPESLVTVDPADNADDSSDDTADHIAGIDITDQVIPHLFQANYSVVVGIEHSNNKPGTDGGSVSAFAKVAGRDWTYYVLETKINIGRPPDGIGRQSAEHGTQSSPPEQLDDPVNVQIDLGPSKHVSRSHAELFYKSEDEKWHILVNGRNGLKLNDTILRRGQQMALSSGDVIEIAGTEMMFVTADAPASIHAKYLARLQEPVKDEEQDRWPVQPHAHPETMSEDIPSRGPPTTWSTTNGQAAIPPAPYNFARQSTPVSSTAMAQSPSQGGINSGPAHQHHGMMMQSNEQIDFSSDAVKDIRPNCSYATLIGQAILSSKDECMSLHDIYQWIMTNFSWFRCQDPLWQVPESSEEIEKDPDRQAAKAKQKSWQNSIRHNLSLNPDFYKIPRRTDEPGKGMKWAIVAEKRDQIKQQGLRLQARGGARKAPTGPNTPAAKKSPTRKRRAEESPKDDGPISQQAFKASPTAQTPPLSTYPPTARESYTPTRGSRISALSHENDQVLPVLSDDATPLPVRPRFLSSAAAAGSPPSLSSTAAYYDEQNSGSNLFTPAPQRHEPKLYAPSTAKLPSMYLPQSSPAPFWKLNSELGSTPAKYFGESSPLKGGGRLEIPPGLQSSSPPPPMAAIGSPTRAKGPSVNIASSSQHLVPGGQFGTKSQGLGISHGSAVTEEDDAPIDILGGFQKIGDRRVSNAAH